ncbi:MAG TPA: N-acetylmuramic acid 6-phosphate etherase [Dongiaceae bacterium]|nr:N-acetylmuramic acid 6-phosphate etherase [Dongiaceae bacterium]
MQGRLTETVSQSASGIDTWPDQRILSALLGGQERAVTAVQAALPDLALAADLAAAALGKGGRLIYVGAGSSGLIAALDALELPGTFGIAPDQAFAIVAGGPASFQRLDGAVEDDADQARADIAAAQVGAADVVLGISASGATIYTSAALKEAQARGAATIGIACNERAPIHQDATVAVTLLSGGEVLAGSTRMGAGTAQKAALNMLSTLIAVKLGHVHDGMMVNVRPENEKLRARAAGIVARIAGVDAAIAQEKLRAADFEPKIAILLAAGAASVPDAAELLTKSKGHLRPALAWLGATPPITAKASGTK